MLSFQEKREGLEKFVAKNSLIGKNFVGLDLSAMSEK